MHIKAKSIKRIDPHLLKLYKRCGCRFDKLLGLSDRKERD